MEGPNQADCCCFLTEGAGGGACEPELVRLLPAPRHRLLGGAGEVAEHLGATPVQTTRRSSPLNSADARIRGDISFSSVLNAQSQNSHNGPHETLEAELMLLSPHHRRIIYLRPNYEPPPASV